MPYNPNVTMRVEGRPEPKGPKDDYTAAVRRETMRQRLAALVARLTTLANEQVAKKVTVETRWLDDLRQYHGRYSAQIEADLKESGNSRLFVNITRPKTHAWEAKLSDMLFPVDGSKNWGIRPTPVPELQQAISQDQPDEPNVASPEAEEAKETVNRAKVAAKGMELEMEDQLKESNYDVAMRKVLHDACKLGTGIAKGPTIANRARRKWTEDDSGNHMLGETEDARPDYQRVDPWSFFPDMSATRAAEVGFAFDRHLYNEKQVRKLAKMPGFDREELRKLLEEGPQEGYPNYVTVLREITGAGQDSLKERFHVWEYHGPIEREDLEAMAETTGKADMLADFDPLEEINVIVWFCQGHLLKFGEQPMESGELLYSMFSFETDDTSIFGFGVPYLIGDSQAALNGAWRMTMDNAALSVGPQVVVDQTLLEPADGNWKLTPHKVWLKLKPNVQGGGEPFTVHNIPNNQAELMAIIALARQFADDETNLPTIEQRGDGTSSTVTRTAMGMAILMNAANIVFRRVVKNFDDEMTVPNIRRLYDWNMQFSRKEYIKGDFEVDARGSSVLLVREIQAQNLMVMASTFTDHSVLGPMTKALALYRKTVEAYMLNPNDIVMSDEEFKTAQQEQSGEQDPEMMALGVKFQIAQLEADTRVAVANMEFQTAMTTLAEQQNMSVAKLQTMLGIKQIETESKERIFASEAAVEAERLAAGDTTGGGGYL